MDSSSYQLFRLWSGICSIGVNLGLIWAVYGASLLFPSLAGASLDWTLLLAALGVASFVVLAFLPFEILIGYAGEAAFSRSRQSFREWLSDWGRSQWFVVGGLAGSVCLFAWAGTLAFSWQVLLILAIIGLVAGLLLTLPIWMKWVGGLAMEKDAGLGAALNAELKNHDAKPLEVRILDDGDEEGVNGVILPFQSTVFTINRAAREQLEPGDLAALAIREQWFHREGQSRLCLGIVLGWVAIGVLLALLAPGGLLGATTPLQLGLGGAAVMTTWSFLALLTWPPLNNRIMLEADAFLAEKIGTEATVALLNKIQTLNESDFDISGAKEHVFHPIPSLRKRLEHLKAI